MRMMDESPSSVRRDSALLDAVVSISSDLDLPSTLTRIVQAACQLVGARYGALGVLSPDRTRLSQFVTEGVSEELRARIGHPPAGHGILGLLISDPRPVRLHDITTDPRAYGFPPGHPPMHTFLGVPVRTRDTVFGNLYLAEKFDGSDFTDEDQDIVVALAAAAGTAIENSRLYMQVARRQRGLEAAAEVTDAVLGDLGRAEALRLVAQRARELTHTDFAAVLLRQRAHFSAAVVEGEAAAHLTSGRLELKHGAAAQALASLKPVIISERVEPEAVFGPDSVDAGWPALGPALLVPMTSGENVLGLLVVAATTSQQEHELADDLNVVSTLAGHAALALDRVSAREQQQQLVVFEDRDRIARDLHDIVIQRLFATGLQIQGTLRLVEDPMAQERLRHAVESIDATIDSIRASIFELRGRSEPHGLHAQIRRVLDDAQAPLGCTPAFHWRGPMEYGVPEVVRPHLLATLREALANVARHANASSVEVQLDVGEQIVLQVSDDGQGMPQTTRRSGLLNLSERAAAFGGSLHVGPRTPTGTLLRWSIPVSGVADA
jgi:signal transduction histidine kinase